MNLITARKIIQRTGTDSITEQPLVLNLILYQQTTTQTATGYRHHVNRHVYQVFQSKTLMLICNTVCFISNPVKLMS